MQQLLAAAAAMQSQLVSAQQELADAEVSGTAGGGLVTAVVNGQGELVDLSISAAAIDASDPEETAQTLADLVLAAYSDACRGVDDLQQQTIAPFAAGLSAAGLPGLSGFPGVPGLGGAADAPGGQDEEDPAAGGAAPGTPADQN